VRSRVELGRRVWSNVIGGINLCEKKKVKKIYFKTKRNLDSEEETTEHFIVSGILSAVSSKFANIQLSIFRSLITVASISYHGAK
jgi:hypothetical protein